MGEYDGLSADELHDELAERELPTSGNKADLIERLQENDTQKQGGDAEEQTTDTTDGAQNVTGGKDGTKKDADRSGQHPAPGDPVSHHGETPGDPRPV